MNITLIFLMNSVLPGAGLAMDAFSVSLANGLHEPEMKKGRMSLTAGVFAVFQAVMPMIGWICVHTVMQYFTMFKKLIPWTVLILLCYIGGKMRLCTIYFAENGVSQTPDCNVLERRRIVCRNIR